MKGTFWVESHCLYKVSRSSEQSGSERLGKDRACQRQGVKVIFPTSVTGQVLNYNSFPTRAAFQGKGLSCSAQNPGSLRISIGYRYESAS